MCNATIMHFVGDFRQIHFTIKQQFFDALNFMANDSIVFIYK